MIKKFILEDSCDNNYSDLIIFEKEVNLEDIKNVIQKKKDELPGEYTSADIYDAINELGVSYRVIYLDELEHILY